MYAKEFPEDMSIAELFLVAEEFGIDCSQLRKAERVMDKERLRASLCNLIKARVTSDAYKEFSSAA